MAGTTWNQFLPISMPITAMAGLSFSVQRQSGRTPRAVGNAQSIRGED
jgi:hypothetical protein